MKGFIKIKYLRVTKLNEMKIKEIFKKIDAILKENEDLPALSEISKGKKRAKSTLQKLFGLFKKIIKTQYAIIASYLKEEFKIAIKNDLTVRCNCWISHLDCSNMCSILVVYFLSNCCVFLRNWKFNPIFSFVHYGGSPGGNDYFEHWNFCSVQKF